MTKGRDNLAATLKDILELVGARRQTGLLSIERLQESRYEEGEVYVQEGRVVYAKVGQLVGQEALLQLFAVASNIFRFFIGCRASHRGYFCFNGRHWHLYGSVSYQHTHPTALSGC